MTFYERYVKCCREKGIQPSSQATVEKIGCARSNVTAFAKSGKTPKGEIVAGAARMLNVSADYLLGIVDKPVPISEVSTDKEATLMSLWRELNEEGKEAAIAMMRGLAGQNIYKTDSEDVVVQKEA